MGGINWKKTIAVVFTLVLVIQIKAQDSKAEADAGVDLVSRYLWRGLNLSSSPAIQPYAEVSAGNFTIGAWGSYTFESSSNQEVDLYVGYQLNHLNLMLFDYVLTADSIAGVGNFFDYKSGDAPHALEAVLTVGDFDNIPFSLTTGVFFYGNDYNLKGDRAYSTYIELGYDLSIGHQPMHAFAGFTTHEGMYSNGFGCVNLGMTISKEISVTEHFSLPLSATLALNPDAENMFLVIGLSL